MNLFVIFLQSYFFKFYSVLGASDSKSPRVELIIGRFLLDSIDLSLSLVNQSDYLLRIVEGREGS